MSSNPRYICKKCSTTYPKWMGKCTKCFAWNTIQVEHNEIESNSIVEIQYLNQNTTQVLERYKTQLKEFDYVCGGGLVRNSVTLIGGAPGIGKSTLLLQIAATLESSQPILYVSGEESINQIQLRANRLQLDTSNIACATNICIETILNGMKDVKPSLLIIDSIQTVYSTENDGGPGSINQMKLCTHYLTQWAKTNNIALILVGHITKEGGLAGPKMIEHMVDTVLYFENERMEQSMRLLRSVKNRFGPTDTIALFEMVQHGLQEVKDPSTFLLKNRSINTAGSCIFAAVEGGRPLLVEMQALVTQSYLQMPRRAVLGWESLRLSMLTAILDNKCKTKLSGSDLYFNIISGIRIQEPASDLAAAIAVLSALYKITISSKIVAFGEICLSGEIRQANRSVARAQEAKKLGFTTIVSATVCDDMQNIVVKHVSELHDWILEQKQRNAS